MKTKSTCSLLALGLMSVPVCADSQHSDPAFQAAGKQGAQAGSGTVVNAVLPESIKAGNAITFEFAKVADRGKWQVTRITQQDIKSPAAH